MDHYILDGHEVVPEPDLLTWARAFETKNRRVARSKVGVRRNKRAGKKQSTQVVKVSTIFLGLDHNVLGDKPHLFETMVFGGNWTDLACERCSTWEEAEKQHRDLIDHIKFFGI